MQVVLKDMVRYHHLLQIKDYMSLKQLNQRVSWIDVCKGILILLMVTGHVPNIVQRLGNDLGIFNYWFLFIGFYGCFFMQTFFILTGTTSNFDIPFKPFLLKQVKTILIPYVSFCCISKIIGVLFFNESVYEHLYGQTLFFLLEGYWFLTAIFIAKLLYWLIRRVSCNYTIRGGCCLLLMILGFLITLCYKGAIEPSHFNNYFHYRNALCMTFFLWVGEVMKSSINNIKLLITSSILFLVLYIATFAIRWKTNIPIELFSPLGFSHTVNIDSLWQIFAYLFYSVTGSLFVILISKYIYKSVVLEYFGKNSIIIYCTHFIFINMWARVFDKLYGDIMILNVVYFVLIIVFTILSTMLMIKLFKYKPFSYLIGKF